MARTLDQIIAELNPVYQPQVQSLQAQQQLIPQQIQSQEQALNAQKDVAFEDIMSGARRRGLGFSGIPLAEQAKYASTNYAPALAGLRQQGQQQSMSLQDAILGINEKRNTLGQQIYQNEQSQAYDAQQKELDRQFTEKQNALNRAATRAAASAPTIGSLYQQPSPQARVVQSKPGSFAFYDPTNKPITAATYARQTNQNIGDILYEMGSNGDKTAKQIYEQLSKLEDPTVYQKAYDYYSNKYPYILGVQ